MLLSVGIIRLVFRFGLEKTFEMIKNAGFEAVDFYFAKEQGKPLQDEKEIIEMAHEVKALCEKYGIVCNQTHAPYRLLENEEYTPRNPHFREIVYAIRGSGALGAKYVVVHPFRHDDGTDEVDDVIAYYRALLPYAKESGVKIATENLFRAAQNPEKMKPYIDACAETSKADGAEILADILYQKLISEN